MKFTKKILALLLSLALSLALALPAFAEDDDPPDLPTTINITVGQIYSPEQLAEEMGYPAYYYNPDGSRFNNIWIVECSGAVSSARGGTAYDGCWQVIYGAEVGQGSVKITFNRNSPPLEFDGFNVTAATNPVVREFSMGIEDNVSIEPLLADLGYTIEDVDCLAVWDNDSTRHGKLYAMNTPPYTISTHNNGTGSGQLLLNMTDGQIILFNVTIEFAPGRILRVIRGYARIFLGTIFSPFILLAPLLIPLLLFEMIGMLFYRPQYLPPILVFD